jgi:hypothetical protein
MVDFAVGIIGEPSTVQKTIVASKIGNQQHASERFIRLLPDTKSRVGLGRASSARFFGPT